MNIALIGYGKMGKMIEQLSQKRDQSITARIALDDSNADSDVISAKTLQGADVCIEFTHPDAAVENIKKLAALGKNIVVGTTGWYDRLDEVSAIVEKAGVGLIYASNFSLGVNLFMHIAEGAAKLMDKFPAYDVGGFEGHHNQKADSPSGTAKTMAGIVLNNISRKTKAKYNAVEGVIDPEELHIASVRCGHLPGTHSLFFDSADDTITLTHQTRRREGLAEGALLAAKWIQGKKGVYTIRDMMGSILNSKP